MNSNTDPLDHNGVKQSGAPSYNTNQSERPAPPRDNPEGLPPVVDAPDKNGAYAGRAKSENDRTEDALPTNPPDKSGIKHPGAA